MNPFQKNNSHAGRRQNPQELTKSDFGRKQLKPRVRFHKEEEEEMDPNAKLNWNPGTMLNPVPVVMVSCGGNERFRPNIITLAWTGTINSEPPMLSVSIRPERHSYEIIRETGEFVVNLTTQRLCRATDWCGVKSGRNVDKFAEMKLTPQPSKVVGCPGIAESPVNIECKVKQIIPLGSHDLFLAEIVGVQVAASLMDKKGKFHLEKAGLLAYQHGEYWSLAKKLGSFGYSVKKN